jgi:hypothetical protein
LSNSDSIDLFRLVVEEAPDGIIFVDREGAIQIWNSAAADFFGYLPEEAVRRSLDLIPAARPLFAPLASVTYTLAGGANCAVIPPGLLCRASPFVSVYSRGWILHPRNSP